MPTFFFILYTLALSRYVRLTGLEPAHREILDPKSSASTNSATGANRRVNFGLTMSIPLLR